ncbi:MAG: RNA polymerase sigma factor [Sphingobacteriia bacterium]|nr:RNA polymerase sigma factor [Sphingobacteriia bacterium]
MEKATYILKAVVQKAQKGDVQAMASLYNQFSKAMYNICYRMCGTVPDAEDVLQESFLIAFKNLHQLKDEQLFGGWLKRIVINHCIQHSKKLFYWDHWEHDEIADAPAEDRWTNIDFEKLNECIKQLPEGCRQIFTLYAVEDFSHKEIADQLGVTEGTSKSQYARARKLLQEKLLTQIAING